MTESKKFSEQPGWAQVTAIAICAVAGMLTLAICAIGAGFLWKAVLWAWS